MSTAKSKVSNVEFLQTLFGGDKWQDAHVTSFPNDPGTLEQTGERTLWSGTKWGRLSEGSRNQFEQQNSYFTISLFSDDATTGAALRRKALFQSTPVIVVDDVGTKVSDVSRLPPPSWALETSPGNFQWGYLLDSPETDARRVNALLDGLVSGGLCPDGIDPGMKGVTRYVRLRVGRNTKGKYGVGGFTCRLADWNPERRYSMEDLASPFGITLPTAGTPGSYSARLPSSVPAEVDDDETMKWLVHWGMLDPKSRASDGVGYEMECPWRDNHTDRADTGTAYWHGGGFKCHHGHCQEKGLRDLERWVHVKLQNESGGLIGHSSWAFTTSAATGDRDGALSAPDEFFAELIYVTTEDRFFSTRTRELITRAAVDFTWGARLEGVGALPPQRPGSCISPSNWFKDTANQGRARIADRLTYWPGERDYFTDPAREVIYANRWLAPNRPHAGLVSVPDGDVQPWLDLVQHIVAGAEGKIALEQVLDWMAMVVGAPEIKPGWHLVVQGGQGLGKDMMAQPMIAGVGEDNHGTVNAGALGGSFNVWAERRLVVVNKLKQNTRGTATGSDQ